MPPLPLPPSPAPGGAAAAPPVPLGGGGAPGMSPAPAIGPATQAQPSPGNLSRAMGDLRSAVRMLEQALPQLPMGSPVHEAVMNAAKTLVKHLTPGDGSSGLEVQSLLQAARERAQGAPMAALMRMQQPNANAPPAMTPPAPPAGPAPPLAM